MSSIYHRPDHFYDYPLILKHANGAIIYDINDKPYVDMFSAMGTISCGHRNQYINNSICLQLDKITASSFFPTEIQLKLIETLNSILPDKLETVSLFSTGSEAIDFSLRLARSITEKNKIISISGHFHGKSHSAMYLRNIFPPSYGIAPQEYSSCLSASCLASKEELKSCLNESINDNTAAIILEPFPGQEGGADLPDYFFTTIQSTCRNKGILLISDEILTGFYRCGDWFASIPAGLSPDIICFGKGLGNGMPISGVACRSKLIDNISGTLPGSTFSGNPVSCASGKAVIDFLNNNPSVKENSRNIETIFKDHFLSSKFDKFDFVPHGKGALLGLTFNDAGHNFSKNLYLDLLKNNIITSHSSTTLRITPPLTIDTDTFSNALSTIENAISTRYESA